MRTSDQQVGVSNPSGRDSLLTLIPACRAFLATTTRCSGVACISGQSSRSSARASRRIRLGIKNPWNPLVSRIWTLGHLKQGLTVGVGEFARQIAPSEVD